MNTVKPETIDSANRKVSALLASTGSSSAKDEGSRQRSRGSCMKFTPEQKAHFARYALESENKRAIMKYSKQWGVDLKESTVRTWKTKYTEGLRKRKPLPIKALPDRKQGRPLLLGDELDTAVQAYVESIRKLGVVVNTAIVLGGAEAIIADKDRTLLDTLAPGKSADRLQGPVIVQVLAPLRSKKSAYTLEILRGTCPTTASFFLTATA